MDKNDNKKSLEEILANSKIEKVDTVDNLKHSFISFQMCEMG